MTWDPVLERAIHPRTVAMVGVSANSRRGEPWHPGAGSFIECFERLGFQGRIYPVNPKASEIMGLKAYPSVSSIPEPLDLVVVSVPADALPGVLEDCVAAKAKNVHVFTAGFEETGEEAAAALGRRVRQIALNGGLRIIGPNCMGLYVPEAGIGTFEGMPKETGPVAFLSQSGSHVNWLSHYGPNYGFYFSKVISFGNAYVLDSTDYLEYLAIDPQTRIICVYLEGVKDGAKLLRQVRAINPAKPVIIWKAGLTESGSRAVGSHTASLAGQEAVWNGFFAQSGAVAVYSLEEMAEMVMTFLYVRPPLGKRVAVIVLGGGSSVAAADICCREGLEVPALREETQTQLKGFIPPAGVSLRNPLDTGHIFRDVAGLERELDLVAADPSIDMIIVRPHLDLAQSCGPGEVERLVRFLSDFSRDNAHGKPAVLVFHSLANDPRETALRARLMVELPGKGVPVYGSLARASRALARFAEYHRIQRQRKA